MSEISDYPPPPPGGPPPAYAPPGPGAPPPAARLPWEERDRLGVVDAFVETLKLIITNSRDAFSRVRQDGDLVSPLLFGMIVSWVPMVIAQLWQMAFGSLGFGGFGGFGGDIGAGLGSGLASLLMTLILWPIIFVIAMVIGTLIYHGSLMLVSGLNNPCLSWEGTFKVLCYAQVAALGNIVPFVGVLISIGAMIYFMVTGFQAVHRSSQGQAIGGALIPWALCCACGVIAGLAGGAAIFTALAGAS